MSVGADIHAQDDDTLRWASIAGHLEVVKYLVSEGADIHAENDCAARWASVKGHLEVVKFLVLEGADIHAENDESVIWASSNGHLEVVKFLVSEGADVNAENDWAVIWASSNGHLEVVKYLVLEGADIDKIDQRHIEIERFVALFKCYRKCRTLSNIRFLRKFVSNYIVIREIQYIPGIGTQYLSALLHYEIPEQAN